MNVNTIECNLCITTLDKKQAIFFMHGYVCQSCADNLKEEHEEQEKIMRKELEDPNSETYKYYYGN